MRSKKYTVFLCAFAFCMASFAADKGDPRKNYEQYAKNVRAEVWSWNKPEFNNRIVPDEYKNASSVLLAWHEDITIEREKNIRYISGNINRMNELVYTNTDRKRVLINDKAALEKYSEFNFRQYERTQFISAYYSASVIGVKIIKPDGTSQEINIDEEAVKITDEKLNKKRKIAIPGLEIGDIIDFFIRQEGRMTGVNPPPLLFRIAQDAPVLSHSARCEIDEKLTVEYRSINGAPQFKTSRDKDNNYILEFHETNLDAIKDEMWVSDFRRLPLIRLIVFNNSDKMIRKPASSRSKGLHKDVPVKDILSDTRWNTSDKFVSLLMPENIVLNKQISAYKKKHPGISQEEFADYIFYAFINSRYNRIKTDENLVVDRKRNYASFDGVWTVKDLDMFFKKFKINCMLVYVPSKYGPRMNEITYRTDLDLVLAAGNKLYDPSDIFAHAGTIDYVYEGEPASTVKVKKYKKKAQEGIVGDFGEMQIPASKSTDNVKTDNIKVSFNEENPTELIIDRNTIAKGHFRNRLQKKLLLFEQYDGEMRKELGMETLMEDLNADRNSRKLIPEYENAMKQAKKEQADYFKEEISTYHDKDPKEVKEYRILNFGLTHKSPEFSYKVDYIMDGYVKKAGNNYIFDIGRIIGEQTRVKDDQRVRKSEIYRDFACEYRKNIVVEIPDGFTVEGLEKLKREVRNASGLFVSDASLSGNQLTVTIEESYFNAFEPISNWQNLLDVTDASADFCNLTILLKK